MAWLRMDTELLGHPKLKKFARGLGIPEAAAAGHLFALWGWAMNYAEDGNLDGFGPDDIASAAGWPGDAKKFFSEAMQCGIRGPGFLEENESGEIVLYRWEDHMGGQFERRKKQAERMREYRERQAATKKNNDTRGVHSTCASRAHNVSITCAVRGQDKTREDPPPYPPPGGGGVGAGVESPRTETPPKAEQPEPSLPAEMAQGSAGARPNVDGKEADTPAAFDAFWATYPRKVQKQTALKAWRTLVRQGASDADILNSAAAYRSATRRRATPQDRIMHPSTFLRENRWQDWTPPDGASYLEEKKLAASSAPQSRGATARQNAVGGALSYAEAMAKYDKRSNGATVDLSPNDWRDMTETEVAK